MSNIFTKFQITSGLAEANWPSVVDGGLVKGLEAIKNILNIHAQVYKQFKALNVKFVK